MTLLSNDLRHLSLALLMIAGMQNFCFAADATQRILLPVALTHEVNPHGGEILRPQTQRFLFKHRPGVKNSTYVAGPWIVKIQDAEVRNNKQFTARVLFEERTVETTTSGQTKSKEIVIQSALERTQANGLRAVTPVAKTLKTTREEVWKVELGDSSELAHVAFKE